MKKIKEAVENNPGLSMVILSFAGLAFPYGTAIPDVTVIVLLAILMFLSCFKINMPLRDVISWKPFAFCAARYVVLPVLLWMICKEIAPSYAVGVLLLALVPAATSSAALTGIYNGNVALALVITIVSSIASVFLIPSIVGSLNNLAIEVPVFGIMRTLALCVFLPGIFYMALRKSEGMKRYSQNYGRFTAVLFLSLLAFISLSRKRDFFLSHPEDMVTPFLIAVAFFGIAIAIGFAVNTVRGDRIANGICSSFNNNSLGVGLSLLYFDEKTIAVLISGLFVWSFLPMAVGPIVKRLQAAN